MSKLAVQNRPRSIFPELSELFEGFPSWAHLRPAFGTHAIPVEDEVKDGSYVLRAEIPGVDPAKDVDITVRNGVLTIKAERSEKQESNGRSEFSYGSFVRSVALPAGADEDEIHATYDRGILTVSVPLSEDQPSEKRVEVIETILVDEDDDFDGDEDEEHDDGQPEREEADHSESEDQHQPVG